MASIEKTLKDGAVVYDSIELDKGSVMLRFDNDVKQLNARDFVKDEKNGLTRDYVSAMSFASRTRNSV